VGTVFVGFGVSSLLSDGSTLVGGLMTLGGVGTILAVGFEVATSEPSTRSPPDALAFRAVVVALFVILGPLLQTRSSLL